MLPLDSPGAIQGDWRSPLYPLGLSFRSDNYPDTWGAQTQQVAHSQPTLDEYIGASLGHTAEEDYVGGMQEVQEAKDTCSRKTGEQDCIYIEDFYNLAKPLNNPRLPEGTRVQEYTDSIIHQMPDELKPWKFKEGEFSTDYKSVEKGDTIKNILREYDVDLNKFENLMESVNVEDRTAIYGSGKILMYDEPNRSIYIVPTKPGIDKPFEPIYN